MNEREVMAILEQNGFKNVSPSLVKEFIQTLPSDDSSDDIYITSIKKSPTKTIPPPQKIESPIKKDKNKQINFEKEDSDSPIEKEISKPIFKKKKKINLNEDIDEELKQWNQKMTLLQNKADSLDQNLQQCKSAILNPPTTQPDVDIPLYFGTSEIKLDPYPVVKGEYDGGYIRPPPSKNLKKKTIKQNPKGRKLLYEEKFPDYVPPPDRRRDALRWSIRKKLIYSHPDYQN